MKTTEAAPHVARLLRAILSRMVLRPELLEVTATPLSTSVILTIRGSKGDTPRLIGEGGSHFRAARIIAEALGDKLGARVQCESVLEPIRGEPDRHARFTVNPDWPREEIEDLIREVVSVIFGGAPEIATQPINAQSSAIVVRVPRHDNPAFVRSVGAALAALFTAVGKACGQVLYVDLAAELEPEAAPR